MAFWLKSVNTLLEKLDDRVETVVEEQIIAAAELELDKVGAGNDGIDVEQFGQDNLIDDILAKRGLANKEDDDDDDEEEVIVEDINSMLQQPTQEKQQDQQQLQEGKQMEEPRQEGTTITNTTADSISIALPQEDPSTQQQQQQAQEKQQEQQQLNDDPFLDDGWDEVENIDLNQAIQEDNKNKPINNKYNNKEQELDMGSTKEEVVVSDNNGTREIIYSETQAKDGPPANNNENNKVDDSNNNDGGDETETLNISPSDKDINRDGTTTNNEETITTTKQDKDNNIENETQQSSSSFFPSDKEEQQKADISKEDKGANQNEKDSATIDSVATTTATTTTTNSPPSQPDPKPTQELSHTAATATATTTTSATAPPPTPPTSNNNRINNTDNNNNITNNTNKQLNNLLRQSQKETRTLRRHVLTLNTQLETSENEVLAQRNELERAADRMEKDRIRHKEEKEKEKNRFAEEMKTFKNQQDMLLKEQKNRFENQLEDIRKQLNIAEEKRMQEGGNWNNELALSLEREQGLIQKNDSLEDERSLLLSQISTLQSQQDALGNRLESLTKTADDAMERERDAEDRLDEVLSQHARQISQRQARETELERTISELGGALAMARDREVKRMNNNSSGNDNEVNDNSIVSNNLLVSTSDTNNNNSDESSMIANLKGRIGVLQGDLETYQTSLGLERQRCETLQQELRDVSKERTEEVSKGHARQLDYDRHVSEMSHTIARLQSVLRERGDGDVFVESSPINNNKVENENVGDAAQDSSNNDDGIGKTIGSKNTSKQIKSLSDQVVRQREKLGKNSSEIAALKSRLKAALDRADKAESGLEEAMAIAGALDDGGVGVGGSRVVGGSGVRNVYNDMELGRTPPSSGNAGGGMTIRRRGRGNNKPPSIRSAMHLANPQGHRSEQIGKAIDAVDSFSVSTGKYLRYNPLARGAFLLYLLFIHLWTFALLFFHAHNFENIHGDFGVGNHDALGPHALMQKAIPLNSISNNREVIAALAQQAKAGQKEAGKGVAVGKIEEGGEKLKGSTAKTRSKKEGTFASKKSMETKKNASSKVMDKKRK